jgi:hypothetical protein
MDMDKLRESTDEQLAAALFGARLERAICDQADDFSPEPGEEFLTPEELDSDIATIEAEIRRRMGIRSN